MVTKGDISEKGSALFKKYLSLFFFILFEVLLIYNIGLVSGVQQNNSDIYIVFRLFSIIGFYKILNIVPCVIW